MCVSVCLSKIEQDGRSAHSTSVGAGAHCTATAPRPAFQNFHFGAPRGDAEAAAGGGGADARRTGTSGGDAASEPDSSLAGGVGGCATVARTGGAAGSRYTLPRGVGGGVMSATPQP
jgi:hypothetical protein